MKIFWYFLILVCGLSGILLGQGPRRDDEWPPKSFLGTMKPIVEECRQQTGVRGEAIKQFSDGEIHDDEALKCYMSCLFQEFNVVDDKGDVHLETLFSRVSNEVKLMSKDGTHSKFGGAINAGNQRT